MKKIILFITVLSFILFLKPVEANDDLEYLNLFNLTNLTYDENTKLVKTAEPIQITPNTDYILIMDNLFGGALFDYAGLTTVSILYQDKKEVLLFEVFDNNIYVKINISYHEFLIVDFEPSMNGKNIMLYKGDISDFKGYVPYRKDEITQRGSLTLNYDDYKSVEEIKKLVTAKNPNTGLDIKLDFLINEYNNDYGIGNKQVIYSTNYQNQEFRYILNIDVIDTTPPRIIGPEIIKVDILNQTSIEDIKKQYRVEDNAEKIDYNKISIIEDGYSGKNEVGEYNVLLEVSDSSGNMTQKEIIVKLLDTKAPILTGPSKIFVYTTDKPLTIDEIIAKFTIIDEASNLPIKTEILGNTYNQTTIEGEYYIRIKVSDALGNSEVYRINITVVDNKGPIFEVSDLIIKLTTKQEIQENEIIKKYKEYVKSNGKDISNIKILHNEYDENKKIEGKYYVYLSFEYLDETFNDRVLIEVQKENNDAIYYILGSAGVALISLGIYIIIKKKK